MSETGIPDYMPNLRYGVGTEPKDGGCLVQIASWLHSGKWTDDPVASGVHPLLRSTAISLNDSLPDNQRHRLIPFIVDIAGTADAKMPTAQGDFTALMRASWAAQRAVEEIDRVTAVYDCHAAMLMKPERDCTCDDIDLDARQARRYTYAISAFASLIVEFQRTTGSQSVEIEIDMWKVLQQQMMCAKPQAVSA